MQCEPIRVAGCGDMSGDVFGNGMLLSKALQARRRVRPPPHLPRSRPRSRHELEERARMFALPRSSWADYNPSLISKGGGVFPRTDKSIKLLEARSSAALGLDASEIDPASADLGDPEGAGRPDLVRRHRHLCEGRRPRTTSRSAIRPTTGCASMPRRSARKAIGEGANLGVTQAGRIAFAAHGGRINTDFIDNSAGVDCSDNEVNIKIALNREMIEGRLAFEDRNTFLAEHDRRRRASGAGGQPAPDARRCPSWRMTARVGAQLCPADRDLRRRRAGSTARSKGLPRTTTCCAARRKAMA